MNIQWLGHACFLFTANDGRTLLTDPFDPSVGYTAPGVPVNVVTCSHDHYDHHGTESLPLGYTVIDQPGVHQVSGLTIEGISSFHDDEFGMLRGRNLIYRFTMDDLSVAHLGDLGHLPTETQCAQLEGIDVLLIPVGGTFTLDGARAADVVRMLRPRIAIPMHYKTRYLESRLSVLSEETDFTAQFEHRVMQGDTLTLTTDTIADYPPVVVLEYQS